MPFSYTPTGPMYLSWRSLFQPVFMMQLTQDRTGNHP
jgi:hypothetical protein